MKSEFRFSYLLMTYSLTAILLTTLIGLALYIGSHFGFLSSKALILYVAIIGGVFGLLAIWNDFITIEINEEKILFGKPFRKSEQLLMTDIIRTRTFYLKRSNTSNRLGVEIIDGYKTLGLILKDDEEIQIQGSVYSNFKDLAEYIIKLKNKS